MEGEVRSDPGATALYGGNASIYRQVPIEAVIPRHAADVVAALEGCRRYGAPVSERVCGAASAGQSVNAAVRRDARQQLMRDALGAGRQDRRQRLGDGRDPDVPRRVTGCDLDSLLPENGFDVAKAPVGSEATCVLALEAKVRLLPDPAHHALLVIGYPDAVAAGRRACRCSTSASTMPCIEYCRRRGRRGDAARAAGRLCRDLGEEAR